LKKRSATKNNEDNAPSNQVGIERNIPSLKIQKAHGNLDLAIIAINVYSKPE
jgi:hypothetical protein